MKINEINSLVELFFLQYKRQNKKDIFLNSLKNLDNKYSWEETYRNIHKLSNEIKKYINKGDRCLIISENRPEWMITDLSIMFSLGITVPAYTTYVERDYEYIMDDCTPSIIFVSDNVQYKKIINIVKKKNYIKKIIFFDKFNRFDEFDKKLFMNISQIFDNHQNSPNESLSNIKINRKDPACIIYTSGTQGNPKGVVLSHGGILNNCEGSSELLKPIISSHPKFLTWLPLSHSYEHTVQFVQIAVAAKVYYAESIDKLIKNMNDCSPEIMTAVPRFYQNLYIKINSTFSKAEGIKKILLEKTVNIGKKKLLKNKISLSEKFFDFLSEYLVRKKLKNSLVEN